MTYLCSILICLSILVDHSEFGDIFNYTKKEIFSVYSSPNINSRKRSVLVSKTKKMKKIFTLLVVMSSLFFAVQMNGQGSESFENANLPSSYSDGSFVGDNSVTWNYVQSRDDAGFKITNEGIMLRRSSSNSKVYSDAVAGGLGDFSCDLKKAYTGAGNRQVELFINGVSKGTSEAFDDTNVHNFSVNGINVSGNVTIEIRDITSKQVIVDNISWTGFSSSNDADAEAADTGSQPTGTTISSTGNDDSNNPVSVFEMTFYDWGASDGLPTHVTNVRLKPKNTNTADWTNNIGGLVLDDGSVTLTPSSVDIQDTYIDIAFNSGDFDVADNTTRDLYIAVYLNTSNIEDGKILSFMVDVDNHGFTADPSGTQFKPVFSGGDFYSNDFTIDVEATEMQYQQQPTDVEVNTVMSPAVTVAYTDVNGNVDVDYNGSGFDVTMTTTGTFSGSATTSVLPVSGIATFDNLIFSATGTGVTITADNGGWTAPQTKTSDAFDVTPAAAPICHEEHFDGGVPDGWTNNGTANETTGTHAGAAANCRAIGSGDDIFSPSFNYPETLEFYQDASGGGNNQTATLEYRIGDAGEWTQFYSFSATTAGKTESVDLTAINTANGDALSSKQYVHFKFLSAFNTWYLDDVVIRGSSCAIPIELLDFSVKKAGNNTLVEWSTLSEENSDYFVVEWSIDGVNFEEIAKIDGAGSSREKIEYSYTHANPSIGVNYYRLVQYDLDGRSESFGVQQVVFVADKKDMFITPTRVENDIRVGFSDKVENGILNIFDMQGKAIKTIDVPDGVDSVNLDVSSLSCGQYIVRYIDKIGTISKRFVKL